MKKAIQYFVLVFFIAVAFVSEAQQDPQYNQYMFNPLAVNAAYAGSRERISVVVLHRSQWVGFEGAPHTQTATIHAPFFNKKLGLGLTIVNDIIGPTRRTGIDGTYAYRINALNGKFAFGIRTGIMNYQFDWNKIEYKDKPESSGKEFIVNKWVPNFDFALRYNNRKFYAGAEVTHLNNPKFDVSFTDSLQVVSGINGHLNFTAGYAYEYSEDIVFKPSVLARASRGGGVFDLNFSVLYKKTLWLGFSSRNFKGLAFIAEYEFNKNFRAGYSFDVAYSRLQRYNAGSHEIFIGFDFGDIRKPRILSPRIYF